MFSCSTCLLQVTYICHLVFLNVLPEPPVCTCGMGSFLVYSGGPVIYFPVT